MLNKDATVPGATIRTRKILKDGVSLGGGMSEIPHITSHPTGHGAGVPGVVAPSFTVGPEEELTVVEKPKKRGGINMCKIRNSQGQEGHVFWCELRISCDHVGV